MIKKILNNQNSYMRTVFILIPLAYLYFISDYISFYPLWDGYYYFAILKSAITNVTNLSDFIGMFNLNSHPSMGYTAYVTLGQLISFNNQYILHCQNILLNLIAGYCFFHILIYFIGKNNQLEATLITAIFLFHPLNNATLLNFNLDYPILIFFTTLIYSYLYKKDLLVILSGVMLVFSKETGIILYLSFLAALYVPLISNMIFETSLKPIRNKLYYSLPMLFLSAYFLVRYSLNQSILFSAGYGSSIDIIKELFTLDLKITWARLLQIFVLNFNWIASVTLALYSISLLNSRKPLRFESEEKLTHFLMILFLFATYLYTSVFLFKLLVHPRYIIVSIFFMLLIFAKTLTESFSNKKIRVAIAGAYLIFTISQNYSSLDPASNILFGTYNLGSHKIVKTDAFISDQYGYGPRDAMAYNLEFTVVDKLVRKLYKTIKVDESSYVITERMDRPSIHPKFRNQNIQPNVVILDELTEHVINSFDHSAKIYYVHIPQKHDSSVGLNIIKANFKIIEKYEIEIDGYRINAYSLSSIR